MALLFDQTNERRRHNTFFCFTAHWMIEPSSPQNPTAQGERYQPANMPNAFIHAQNVLTQFFSLMALHLAEYKHQYKASLPIYRDAIYFQSMLCFLFRTPLHSQHRTRSLADPT